MNFNVKNIIVLAFIISTYSSSSFSVNYVFRLDSPGTIPVKTSCNSIKNNYPNSLSGDYELLAGESYCDMNFMPVNRSCNTLIHNDKNLTSGYYNLINGSFYCDMVTDGGGWTKVYSRYFVGMENGPVRQDMYPVVGLFRDFGSSAMMIDLDNRWFVMDGLTHGEFSWMWNSGSTVENRRVASSVRTSIGKSYDGSDFFWKTHPSQIYQAGLGNGDWDTGSVFDLGDNSSHGPAFWDDANGTYKINGGYQTPTNLTMSIYIK